MKFSYLYDIQAYIFISIEGYFYLDSFYIPQQTFNQFFQVYGFRSKRKTK